MCIIKRSPIRGKLQQTCGPYCTKLAHLYHWILLVNHQYLDVQNRYQGCTLTLATKPRLVTICKGHISQPWDKYTIHVKNKREDNDFYSNLPYSQEIPRILQCVIGHGDKGLNLVGCTSKYIIITDLQYFSVSQELGNIDEWLFPNLI